MDKTSAREILSETNLDLDKFIGLEDVHLTTEYRLASIKHVAVGAGELNKQSHSYNFRESNEISLYEIQN